MGWTPSVTIGKEKVSKHKKHWENQTKPQNKKTTQDSCLGSLQSQEFWVFAKNLEKTNDIYTYIFIYLFMYLIYIYIHIQRLLAEHPHAQDLWKIGRFFCFCWFSRGFFGFPKKQDLGKFDEICVSFVSFIFSGFLEFFVLVSPKNSLEIVFVFCCHNLQHHSRNVCNLSRVWIVNKAYAVTHKSSKIGKGWRFIISNL